MKNALLKQLNLSYNQITADDNKDKGYFLYDFGVENGGLENPDHDDGSYLNTKFLLKRYDYNMNLQQIPDFSFNIVN